MYDYINYIGLGFRDVSALGLVLKGIYRALGFQQLGSIWLIGRKLPKVYQGAGQLLHEAARRGTR